MSGIYSESVTCPHCRVDFADNVTRVAIGRDSDGPWNLLVRTCPRCLKMILHLEYHEDWKLLGLNESVSTLNTRATLADDRTLLRLGGYNISSPKTIMVRPRGSTRGPVPDGVPKEIVEEYSEACRVLPDSAKASAALSRRCLQHIFREMAESKTGERIKQGKLSYEIQQVLDSGTLPRYLSEQIDAIRVFGNFAAHPNENVNTGEIVPVEPAEADASLDIIEALFDFYFVMPKRSEERRSKTNAKLKDAGMNPMK